MKKLIIYFCVVIIALQHTLVCCSDDDIFTRIKRHVYNYFNQGQGDGYGGDSEDYYVNECGYIASGYSTPNVNYNEENFVTHNSFPVTEKVITINDTELATVITLAKAIRDAKCSKETVLQQLGIGTELDGCTPDMGVGLTSLTANLLEIIYELLAHLHNVGPFDIVKFTTNNPLPSTICSPLDPTLGISELDRLLPPYCVLDDSKALRRLPTPRSLSLLFEEYKQYEAYSGASCMNLFAYFLFQAFSHDVQRLVNKTVCGDNCFSYTGCSRDGKLALVDTLRPDTVHVLHVCPADPFYGFYGTSCLTYPKLQNANVDCEIRKRAPLNRATPFIDLSFIYVDWTAGAGGSVPQNGDLPDFKDERSFQTTPLLVTHILFAYSHNAIAKIAKDASPSLTEAQAFAIAKRANTYLWQRVLFEFLLPSIFGPLANQHYSLDSTESCFDAANKVQVPVEAVIVALSYCHAYIPAEYELLASNYEFFDKHTLHKKLSPEKVHQFYPYLLRGLFAKKVQQEKNDCSYQSTSGHKADIRALDVQTGRDLCVEPFVQYLATVYNVSPKGDWNAYRMFLPGNVVDLLSYLYKSPQELELTVGGSLDNRNESVFGDLFKIILSTFFSNVKCSDPKFWTNALSGYKKEFLINFDVQDWLACVSGLTQRPYDLFRPYGASNPLVAVTCKSHVDAVALAALIAAGGPSG